MTLGLAVALAVGLSACGDAFVSPAAVVDGRRLTQEFVRKQFAVLLLNPQLKGQVGDSEATRKDFTRRLLTLLIETELIREYAERHHITISDREVAPGITQLVQQNGGQAKFDRALTQDEIAVTDVRESLKRQGLIPKVADAVVAERLGSSASLLQAYRQGLLQFMTFSVSSVTARTKTGAEVIRRTASSGGDVAWASTNTRAGSDLSEAQQAQVSRLTGVGEFVVTVEQPQKAGGRWTVTRFQVTNVVPFEEAKPQLLAPRRDQEFVKWLRLRLVQAHIEVNPKFGTFNEKTAVISPITTT